MLIGSYKYKVSKDLRVTIPGRFLEDLISDFGSEIYLCKLSECIVLMSQEGITKLFGQTKHGGNRDIIRYILRNSYQCQIDSNNRIKLPKTLADSVSIIEESFVEIIGTGDYVEIWNHVLFEKSYLYESIDVMFKKETSGSNLNKNNDLLATIFISYSWENQKEAEEINSLINNIGLKTFLDKKDIAAGEYISFAVSEALDNSKLYLFLISEQSVDSFWCKGELSQALDIEKNRKETFIIPVLINECKIPGLIRNKKYINYTGDRSAAQQEIVKTLYRIFDIPNKDFEKEISELLYDI